MIGFRRRRRFLALVLAFLLLFPSLSAFSVSLPSLGTIFYQPTLAVAEGVTYTNATAWNPSFGMEESFLIEYTPGDAVVPIAAFGSKLYGRSTVEEGIGSCEGLGTSVVAAINADFYSLQTGLPLGIVIAGGRLLSSDAGQNAIGFLPDGSAVIGKPALSTTLTLSSGETVAVDHVNKLRQPYGLYLLTPDFSGQSRNTTPGTDIILEVEEGAWPSVRPSG